MAATKTNIKTLEGASELMGVPRRTLQRWLQERAITGYAIKGDTRRYIDVNEVDRLRTPVVVSERRDK
jgi:excisionase family DNA binding protein